MARRAQVETPQLDLNDVIARHVAKEVERILGPYGALLAELAAVAKVDVAGHLRPHSAARRDFDSVTRISIAELPPELPLADVLSRFTRQVVERAIRQHGGNRERAAKGLKAPVDDVQVAQGLGPHSSAEACAPASAKAVKKKSVASTRA